MKRKLIILSLPLALAMTLAGGATFALFTDQASNKERLITAGTVDIDSYRDGFDTVPGPMFYTTACEGATPTNPSFPGLKPTGPWVPGMTVVRSIIVYNQGSLDVVLDKVKAEVESDPANMASQMTVGIYKVMPKNNENGHPFFPVPGDDTMDQDLLDLTSSLLNPFIILTGHGFHVSGFQQALIEHFVDTNADLLWSGSLSELCREYQNLTEGVNMKSKPGLTKRGCLLAFVVHMDENAGNEYQGVESKFGFTLNATQKDNR